jgi:hypothetical protein
MVASWSPRYAHFFPADGPLGLSTSHAASAREAGTPPPHQTHRAQPRPRPAASTPPASAASAAAAAKPRPATAPAARAPLRAPARQPRTPRGYDEGDGEPPYVRLTEAALPRRGRDAAAGVVDGESGGESSAELLHRCRHAAHTRLARGDPIAHYCSGGLCSCGGESRASGRHPPPPKLYRTLCALSRNSCAPPYTEP